MESSFFHAIRKNGLCVRCVHFNSSTEVVPTKSFAGPFMWLRRMHMAPASDLLQQIGRILQVV